MRNGGINGRILLQVQDKARDSQPESSDAQERQEGDARDVPDLWDESVPDRERIERQSTATKVTRGRTKRG